MRELQLYGRCSQKPVGVSLFAMGGGSGNINAGFDGLIASRLLPQRSRLYARVVRDTEQNVGAGLPSTIESPTGSWCQALASRQVASILQR